MRVPVCLVLLGAAALAAPLAATAMASEARADLPPSREGRAVLARFNALDSDLDGGISAKELRVLGKTGSADALFALLAGPDGRISVKQAARRGNPALVARLEAYDVNKDGYVTRREFPNTVDPALFAALDTNRDGRLSLAELRPAFAGSHASRPAPIPVRVAKKPAPRPQPWCWVPGPGVAPWLGGRHWFLQVPVVQSPDCRTD
ncbi:MAG: hypothetical protein M0006_04920 [Magnetospirillum sp.]|nr:hypothetical protein [Magnetospirillum sp.]